MVIHFVIYTMNEKEKYMSKVYSYTRVSSISQSDNTSIKHQKEVIRNYCETNGLELIEIVEEVFTGTTEERDGLKYIMDKVKSGDCDTLIIYKLDRLFRSFRSGINYITDLMDLGCKIHSTTEHLQTDTISGKFFMNILLSMSEMDISNLKKNMMRGKTHKHNREGKRVCSSQPFGYTKVDGDIVEDKTDSKIVRFIFSLYRKYLHLTPYKRNKRILNLLTKRGWMFKNKPFQSYHIKMIIKNGFYKGDLSFGKNGTTKHNYPTIISSRMFNLCNGV